MRKLIYGGLAAAILGTCGIYGTAYWCTHTPDWEPQESTAHVRVCEQHSPSPEGMSGGTQLEVLEPIVVERSTPEPEEGSVVNDDALREVDAVKVVVTVLGIGQTAPRPDAEIAPRMPFADEDVPAQAAFPLGDVVTQLVDLLRDKQLLDGFFGDAEEASEASDAEPQPEDSNELPAALTPIMNDYHHHHPSCPYTGGCPAHYRYPQVPPINLPARQATPMPMK